MPSVAKKTRVFAGFALGGDRNLPYIHWAGASPGTPITHPESREQQNGYQESCEEEGCPEGRCQAGRAEADQGSADQVRSGVAYRRQHRPGLEGRARRAGSFTLPGLLKITSVNVPAKPKRKGINPFTKEEQWFAAKPATVKVKIRPLKKLKDSAA